MTTKLIQIAAATATSSVAGVSFSAHPQYAGLRLTDAPPQVFDFRADRFLPTPVTVPATAIAFRPHVPGTAPLHEVAVAAAGAQRNVLRFDARDGTILPPVEVKEARSVCYSHDSKMLATGGSDGWIKLFTLDDGLAPSFVVGAQVADSAIVDMTFGAGGLYGFTANGGTFRWEQADSADGSTICLRAPGGGRFDWDCYTVTADAELRFVIFAGEGGSAYALAPATGEITTLDTAVGPFVRAAQFNSHDYQLTLSGLHAVEVWKSAPFRSAHVERFPDVRVLAAKTFGEELVVVASE